MDRLDIWQYISGKGEIVPLYFAAPRPTVERDGLILMVDDERFPLMRAKRGHALGAVSHIGLLSADRCSRKRRDDDEVIQEMLLTTTSERQGRHCEGRCVYG